MASQTTTVVLPVGGSKTVLIGGVAGLGAAAVQAMIDNLAATLAGEYAPVVVWSGTGSQPVRPATPAGRPVMYVSPVQPATGGTVAGGGNAVLGLDLWLAPS